MQRTHRGVALDTVFDENGTRRGRIHTGRNPRPKQGPGTNGLYETRVEEFTLHVNQHRGRDLLFPILLVPAPIPVSVQITENTPLHMNAETNTDRSHFFSHKGTIFTKLNMAVS